MVTGKLLDSLVAGSGLNRLENTHSWKPKRSFILIHLFFVYSTTFYCSKIHRRRIQCFKVCSSIIRWFWKNSNDLFPVFFTQKGTLHPLPWALPACPSPSTHQSQLISLPILDVSDTTDWRRVELFFLTSLTYSPVLKASLCFYTYQFLVTF